MRYVLMAAITLSVVPWVARAQESETTASPVVGEPLYSSAIEHWTDDIVALEGRDQTETHGDDSILFIGSSSIRRWDDIAVDMAPYPVIQRGYGGARYSDLAIFASRLIHPHLYRALVVFVANDIDGKPNDPSVEQVAGWVRHIVDVSRQHQPDSPVLLIEVTPTRKRWEQWAEIRKVNAAIREIALSTPMTFHIATAEHYLDPRGMPREDLFVDDGLHLNEAGYAIWSDLIRDRLDHVFRLMAKYPASSP